MSWGDFTKSNGMNYDDSLARKVQISTMTWDSCPNPILTPEWFFDTSTYFNNGWEWCGSTNWCGYIHHSCREKKTSGMGATDTVTLRFRYPVWFGECSQRSPPQKKMLQKIGTPQQTNGGSYNPGLTPNIFSWCMMMHPQAKESWSVVSLAKVSCLIALLTPWSCFRVFETMVCYLQLDIPTIDRFYQSSHGNLPRVGLLSKHFPMDRKTLNSSIHTRYSTSDFGR